MSKPNEKLCIVANNSTDRFCWWCYTQKLLWFYFLLAFCLSISRFSFCLYSFIACQFLLLFRLNIAKLTCSSVYYLFYCFRYSRVCLCFSICGCVFCFCIKVFFSFSFSLKFFFHSFFSVSFFFALRLDECGQSMRCKKHEVIHIKAT